MRRQRSPRPLNVQRENVPMPNGFLPPRMRRDALNREVHFNEVFGISQSDFAGVRAAFDFDEAFRIGIHLPIIALACSEISLHGGPF